VLVDHLPGTVAPDDAGAAGSGLDAVGDTTVEAPRHDEVGDVEVDSLG